jgi:MscS family membrane protein
MIEAVAGCGSGRAHRRLLVKTAAKPIGSRAKYLGAAVLIGLLLGFSCAPKSADFNPLRPVDTSSPRATLQGFVEAVDELYLHMTGVLKSYTASDRLYFTPEERRTQLTNLSKALSAIRSLDTSDILPVLKDAVAVERAIQLKEILDRIKLPSFDEVPDRETMAQSSAKRWRLPDTEIDIVLIESGPRAGEYLISADTVDRLPGFYRSVRKLPYKPGPAMQLADAYRTISSNRSSTIYEAYSSSPIGLQAVIPLRWMLNLPSWARAEIAGVAVWQWLGFGFALLIGLGFVFGVYRLARYFAFRREEEDGPGWHSLLTPLAVIILAGLFAPTLCKILRIGGSPLVVIAFAQTIALFLSAAWLSMIGAGILAEAIVSSEHLRARSLDSQLIRLGMRLVGIVVAIGLLIQGCYELGFPAYSVLAGLGVGGLAVALAARDSLANLLGSLLIMLEKPFRVGHVIRLTGSEGTVEDVGFRSTRLRTADNSLISIPNNTVVNTTVENLSLRPARRQRFFVQVTYDTPRNKLEALADGIKQLIADHPLTNKTNPQVRFNNFSESSLDILVMFHLEVADYTAELKEREEILLQIMDLAKEIGVEFAFPTRTLYVETPSAGERSENTAKSRSPLGAVLDRVRTE